MTQTPTEPACAKCGKPVACDLGGSDRVSRLCPECLAAARSRVQRLLTWVSLLLLPAMLVMVLVSLRVAARFGWPAGLAVFSLLAIVAAWLVRRTVSGRMV